MKTHDTTSDNDSKSRAAANDSQQKTGLEQGGKVLSDISAQRREARTIEGSPFMVSQRKRMRSFSEPALQKQGLPEEEDLMQGKAAAQMQPEEDEELLQGKLTAQRQSPEEEELMQGKFIAQMQVEDEEELLQGKFTDRLSGAPKGPGGWPTQQKQETDNENLTGMPGKVKDQMEKAFTNDFSDVRVHQNSGKAKEVGALAYTQGANVHFAPGQFKPETPAGRQLLGHELAHVVQQRQGRVRPTSEVAGLLVNDSPELEKEADRSADMISRRSR